MKDSFFKIKRHYRTCFRHLTATKIINTLLSLYEHKNRKSQLLSKPYVARINTISSCNLQCKGCKGSGIRSPNESKHTLSLQEYKTLFDKLSRHLLFVILYDEGEPLLHPSIIDIIKHTSANNVGCVISSNFSMPLNDGFMRNLINSGLSRLIVALDGMTQGVYGKYRTGGDVENVKNNLIRFCEIRKHHKSSPSLEIQYLDFGYNSHELSMARRFSKDIGADFFSPIKADTNGWHANRTEVSNRKKMGCSYIWSTIDINNDGFVYPCDYGEDHGFNPIGDMRKLTLDQAWNNPYIVGLRKQFKSNNELSEQICKTCPEAESAPGFLR